MAGLLATLSHAEGRRESDGEGGMKEGSLCLLSSDGAGDGVGSQRIEGEGEGEGVSQVDWRREPEINKLKKKKKDEAINAQKALHKGVRL